MPADIALLSKVPAFAALDESERRELASRLESARIPAGKVIFEYGDPGNELYIICSGVVEAYLTNDTGHRIVLETTHAGDLFGELPVLDGGPRTATVVVKEDLEALVVSREALDFALAEFPTAVFRLITALARRLRQSGELLRHTASRNVNQEMEDLRTPVQRAADWISEFSGSIPFLLMHIVFFAAWILWNSGWLPAVTPFDGYPFGFLTLVVSLEAIILSVFVLLSQNRQAAKDRIRSDVEYDVNLKAELEVAHLHEKVDRLTSAILARLETIERSVDAGGRAATRSPLVGSGPPLAANPRA